MDRSLLASSTWYATIESLCVHMHDDQFPELLVKALAQISVLNHGIILAYPKQGRPLHIYNNLPESLVLKNLDSYMTGAYLIDPFYDFCSKSQAPGFYRLRDVAPDDFFNSDYFKNYYVHTGLRDEIGLFIQVDEDFNVGISFGLFEGDPELSSDDIDRLKLVEPLILELCNKHWQTSRLKSLFSQTEIKNSKVFGTHLKNAFINFGRDHLSVREREVIRLILKGHSSKSVARELNISPDTVKVHRKNFHYKLGISSQGELFSMFLNSFSLLPPGSNDDPLTRILRSE
ncbi:MAG: helix-turn-helix transcriptional regulator [Amphritea sp.]